jgi:uncharacterized protein (DUF736 family)
MVFNVDQIEGLPDYYYAKPDLPLNPVERIAHAEAFFAGLKADTLTIKTRATFEPVAKRGDKSPNYQVTVGLAEIGAAWKCDNADEHLSVRLDDPSFPAPINCRLVKSGSEHGFSLIWERDRKRS